MSLQVIRRAAGFFRARFGELHLHTQVLLSTALVLALLSLLYVLQIDQRMRSNAGAALSRQANALASSLATGSAQSLVTRDFAAIEQNLLSLVRFPGLRSIVLTDATGIVISAVETDDSGDASPNYGLRPMQPPGGGAAREQLEGDQLVTWVPIMGSRIIGWVRVEFSMGALAAERRAWRFEAILFALALFLVTTAVLWHLLRRSMRPLDRVVEFARNLPDNVGAGLDIEASSSEVADLVKALNQASTTLDLQYMALECSQAITDGILRMSMDGIITLDRGGRLMSANQATETLLGYSLKTDPDSIPPLWDMIVDAAQGAALRDEIAGGVRDGGTFVGQRVECNMRHRDGTIVPVEISISCVDASRADLYAANLRNIEEQQVFERALVERNERLNMVLELSPDGFVMINGEGRIAYANPAFCDMTGLHAQEVQLLQIGEFAEAIGDLCADPANGPGFRDIDDLMGKTGRLSVLARPEHRVVQMAARRRNDVAVLCVRDVTRETEVDRMKSQFLSSAAHELRTPMVSVLGFTELLLKRRFDESRQRTMLETIHRQSKLLVGLINELLDLARIEARRGADFQMRPLDLRDVVRDTVGAFLAPDDPRQVAMTIPDDEAPIVADADKLRQALTNLVSNAYKYSPNGGEISVTFSARDKDGVEYLGVEVRDRGMGMTPEQLSKAFERFYRADASGNIPGTGLGLSLVKEIVQLMHGFVTLESTRGEGTQATIWLPRRSDGGLRLAA